MVPRVEGTDPLLTLAPPSMKGKIHDGLQGHDGEVRVTESGVRVQSV